MIDVKRPTLSEPWAVVIVPQSEATGTYCPRCDVYTAGTPVEVDCDECGSALRCAVLA